MPIEGINRSLALLDPAALWHDAQLSVACALWSNQPFAMKRIGCTTLAIRHPLVAASAVRSMTWQS